MFWRAFKSGLVLIPLLTLLGCQTTRPPEASASLWLPPDQPTRVDFPLAAAAQTFVFNADPSGSTILTLYNLSPGLPYSAEVKDSRGSVVASLYGLQQASLALGSGDSLYQVTVKSNDIGKSGALSLAVGASLPSPASTSAAQAAQAQATQTCSISNATADNITIYDAPDASATPIALLPPNVPLLTDARAGNGWYRVYANGQVGWLDDKLVSLSGSCAGSQTAYQQVAVTSGCSVSSGVGGNVNVRSGPGLNYGVIGALPSDAALAVTGRSDNGWFQVDASGQTGWVSGTVTVINGLCDSVPVIAVASPTTAPADAEMFAFEVDRLGSGSFNERISYPEGDRSDLVRLIISHFSLQPPDNFGEFSLTLVCTGQGTESVRWGAPENPSLECGRSIVLPFTAGFNSQYFAINLPDGSAAGLVNYTLLVARR